MWWQNNKTYLKPILAYLGTTAFCVLFTLIYYVFSRGLRSNYMTFLFAVPLPFLAIALIRWAAKIKFSWYGAVFMGNSCGLAVAYFALSGIYEMAYVSSHWLIAFLILSIACLLFALAYECVTRFKGAVKRQEN